MQTALQIRRRVFTELGTRWPWTVELRYAVSGILRRLLRSPVEQEFRVVKFLNLHSDDVFCDIGCNRGQSIESFLMFNDRCRFVGFEPNPIMFARVNSKYRGNSKIVIHNVGLSASSSHQTLFVPKYRTTFFDELASFDRGAAERWLSDSRLIGFDHRLVSLAELPCELATLDAYALSPAFIKIDVQGYEKNVVEGGWATIEAYKPVLLIENDEPAGGKAVMNRLGTLGYLPYRFDGKRLRRHEFGSPNTFYMAAGHERGLERLIG